MNENETAAPLEARRMTKDASDHRFYLVQTPAGPRVSHSSEPPEGGVEISWDEAQEISRAMRAENPRTKTPAPSETAAPISQVIENEAEKITAAPGQAPGLSAEVLAELDSLRAHVAELAARSEEHAGKLADHDADIGEIASSTAALTDAVQKAGGL